MLEVRRVAVGVSAVCKGMTSSVGVFAPEPELLTCGWTVGGGAALCHVTTHLHQQDKYFTSFNDARSVQHLPTGRLPLTG